MRQALRRFGGQALVDAEDAPSDDDYVCPVCLNPVYKRNRATRAACFAHYTGFGSESCELFFSISGGELAGFNPTEEHAALTSRPWSIALAMKLGADRRTPPGWGLVLSIPTPGVFEGSVKVDVGGRVQDIDLAFNKSPTRIVVAEPNRNGYRVLGVLPKQSPLDIRLLKECQGLREGCTAFGHLARPTQLIRRATEIYAGQDYVLVWSTGDAPNLPEEFEAQPIETLGEWHGAMIHVPSYRNEWELRWLGELVDLPVRRPLPSIIAVWPPLCDRNSAKSIEAAPSRNYLFAIDSLDGRSTAVFVRDRSRVQAIDIANSPQGILALIPDGDEEFKVVARASNEAEVLVRQTYFAGERENSGLFFTFSRADGLSTVSACDSRLAGLVHLVRRGDAELISSRGPAACTIVLRNRVRGLWIERSAGAYPGHEVADLVRSILRWPGDLQFDFGALGHALIEEPLDANDEAALSDEDRKLILSYLYHFPHSRHRKIPNYKRMSNSDLIAEFLRVVPTRRSLAHHRALSTVLQKLPN